MSAHAALEAELSVEVEHVAQLLGRPVLRLPGACGLVPDATRSTTWVFGPHVDAEELVTRLLGPGTRPDLLVREGVEVDEQLLSAAGWVLVGRSLHLRHDAPHLMTRGVQDGYRISRLGRQELPELRELVDRAFGSDDSAEVFPDDMLELAGLRLFGARTADGRLVATVGSRERARGRLLFALATDREHRRRGLAAALLAAASTCSPTPHVDLECEPGTAGLYHRLGFVQRSSWRRWVPAPAASTLLEVLQAQSCPSSAASASSSVPA